MLLTNNCQFKIEELERTDRDNLRYITNSWVVIGYLTHVNEVGNKVSPEGQRNLKNMVPPSWRMC